MLPFASTCPENIDSKCNYSQSLRAVKSSFAAIRALLLQYMVKRKGLDFTEYGLADARAAKRQRLSGDSNDPKYVLNPHAAGNSVLYNLCVHSSLCAIQTLLCQEGFHHWVASKLVVSCVRLCHVSYLTTDITPLHLAAAIASQNSTLLLDPAGKHVMSAVNPP